MEQLILNIKSKSKVPFLKELLKRMEFVEIVEIVEPKKTGSRKKQLLNDIGEAVDFVNKHKAGKVKAKTIQQLLNEL
jgi:hypothetical protein